MKEMAKKRTNLKRKIEEDIIDIAEDKEDELLRSFEEDDEDYEIIDEDENSNDYEEEPIIIQENISDSDLEDEYEEFDTEEDPERKKRWGKVFTIILTILTICLIMILIDVISVKKYNKGPYFAIRTHRYNDGGTTVYHGIGYKVIEYNQVQGRRDKEIGTWSLKYNAEPITIQDIDLAIEVRNNEQETYNKYHKKFVRIISTLKDVNQEERTITIGFTDEEGEYTTDIICSMVEDQENLEDFTIGEDITIIGTVTDIKEKTNTRPIRIYISNCFAEQ